MLGPPVQSSEEERVQPKAIDGAARRDGGSHECREIGRVAGQVSFPLKEVEKHQARQEQQRQRITMFVQLGRQIQPGRRDRAAPTPEIAEEATRYPGALQCPRVSQRQRGSDLAWTGKFLQDLDIRTAWAGTLESQLPDGTIQPRGREGQPGKPRIGRDQEMRAERIPGLHPTGNAGDRLPGGSLTQLYKQSVEPPGDTDKHRSAGRDRAASGAASAVRHLHVRSPVITATGPGGRRLKSQRGQQPDDTGPVGSTLEQGLE